jgi:hypothetical protein
MYVWALEENVRLGEIALIESKYHEDWVDAVFPHVNRYLSYYRNEDKDFLKSAKQYRYVRHLRKRANEILDQAELLPTTPYESEV